MLNPEELALKKEKIQYLYHKIDQLKPKYREIFLKRALYGTTYKELAIELGISTTTVRLKYKKAVNTLREMIKW